MKSVNSKLVKIRKNIDKFPTEGQKESGNYKMGHISINGFKITIENPKGSYRKGVDSNGKEWKTKMNNDYGYFNDSVGYDGDHVDVFLGSNFDSDKIFVVDQKKGNKFDESKVMLGFNTEKEAKNAYLSNYEKGWDGFHKITEVPINNFKEWLYDGKKQRKPFYQYKDNKKNTKKMKINESTLRNLIQECIKKVVMKEDKETNTLTHKLIKNLYKVAQNYKHKYHDDDWNNVHVMMDEMSQLDGIADFSVGGGRYHNFGSTNADTFKQYTISIETKFGTKISGKVNCHLCGTMEDPYAAYDISVGFSIDRGGDMFNESVIKEDVKNAFTNLLSNSDLTTIPKKQVQMVNINGKNFWGIVFDKKVIDDSINFQEKIHDFLSKNPQLQLVTIDGNSAVIINKDAKEGETLKINENNEHFDEKSIYTMENWNNDGTLKPKVNQLVDNEVIEELANSVPPTIYSRGIFQPGEAYDMSEEYTELYMTFVREESGWKYVGLCPKGSTKQLPRIDYSQFNESVDKSNLLSELDWRTYASASEKARQLSDDAPDKYERMRRDRQRHAFYLKGNDEYSKQYDLEDFDNNEKLPNSERKRIPSQGELKRASQRIKDMTNFYQGKQEYKDGMWQDKEM